MPRLLTAVMDVATGKVEKFAYKPWGMRRNPANWAAEVVNDYPARFSRGYCMHEHLPNLGLINMGGRVYNARTNQFISPDPYRQAPDSWLNCNRFGYCMNNPVMYSDPTGEYFGIDDIIAMVVGGLANSIAQCVSGNVDNVGQFFAYFGVGAVSGEVAIYNPVAAGMIVGGSNAALNGVFSGQGVSFGNIFMGTCMGAVTSYAGTWLTNTFSGAVSSLTSGLNQFARNAITNITSGAAAGYIMGFGFSYLNNGDFGKALEEGKRGAIMGAATGTMGTIGQAIKLFKNGCNPWTGKREIFPDNDLVEQKVMPEPHSLGNSRVQSRPSNLVEDEGGSYSVYEGRDPKTGEVKYVGITKRDPRVRWAEHQRSGTPRAELIYKTVDGASGLSNINGRIWEQDLINYYKLENLYNQINSIAPSKWPQFNIKSW